MNIRRIVAGIALAATATVAGACEGEHQLLDLKGVDARDPDKAELINNVDNHPNFVRLCIDGVAFATLNREENPVLRVPEWDEGYCEAEVGDR